MGTKRPSGTLFDTLPNINTSDRKLQPGGKISRDPSPRPAMTAQSERDRDRDRAREEDWRERETVKMREKARYKDTDPRDRYPERDRAPAPRPREGEREWRERERRQDDNRSKNGRPLSNLEKVPMRDVNSGMNKGDTFPRMRKGSPRPGRGMAPEDWERERERTRQRDWYRERDREEIRSRGKEEWKKTGTRSAEEEKSRKRERYLEPDSKDRTRERGASRERRERDEGRKRDTLRPNMREREDRGPSPHRRKDKEIYPDRKEMEKRRVGRRDTRSEGDSDERDRRREKMRDKEKLTYKQSISEGDEGGTTRERDRDRQRHREQDRQGYRDGDRSKRKEGERYRDRRGDGQEDRWKEGVRDRREADRYREYEQRGKGETKEKGPDQRRDDKTDRKGRTQSETAPRVPPRAQSSGEWSSDMDSETRYRRGRDSYEESVEEQRNPAAARSQPRSERDRAEMTEGRRMWLPPQSGKNSKDRERHMRRGEDERRFESQAEWEREGRRVKEEPDERYLGESSSRGRHEDRGDRERETEGVSVDGEEVGEVWREEVRGRLSDSDGGIEGGRRRDAEGENVTDNTEESDREEELGSDYSGRSENEGGSGTGWRQERDRMLSQEGSFNTASSGGEREDDEEKFMECQESWEGACDEPSPGAVRRDEEGKGEGVMGKEEAVEEEEDGQQPRPKVYCVIGQTLPRSTTGKKSESQVEQMGGVERNNQDVESRHRCRDEATQQPHDDLQGTGSRNDEKPIISNQDTERKSECDVPGETSEVDVRYRSEGMKSKAENPYAEIGTVKRDSQTEKLLTQWREKNKEPLEGETLPSNPYGDVGSQVNFEQIQPLLEGINTGAMSPEEVEAIRIRMSGAWSMSEEPKRHSQAPHLKWAKNVVREILGRSEENTVDEPNAEVEQGVERTDAAIQNDKREEEEEIGEVPEEHTDPEEEEEPLEVEGLRDEEDRSKSWGEVELRNVLDTIDRRKRNSRFFNAAQLYQQYSEAAQNFEILRQARSDVVSVCEDNTPSPAPSPPPARRPLPPLPPVPHPHSLSHTCSLTSVKSLPLPEPHRSEGRPSSPRLSIALTQSATLWRELPGVRNSTELEVLSEDERRLQEVRFEVVTSEASYCRSLDIVVEHFVKSKQLGALLTTQDRNWLFSRLADVRAISHSFLSKLEERVETDIINFTVCDIIARHCQRFKMVYVPYLTNQSYQDATYQRLMNENQGFRRIVEKLERSPVCQRLPLRSFLVLPFQRITRIKLLVQNIVKRTTPGTPEATQAIKSMKLLEKLIQESNDSITQMKSIESLVCLSAKVDFECRTLPLISQSRRLVREGPVTELMDFSLKDTERNIYLHLFNDYLLLSLQKEGGRFTVIDHAPVSDLRAENCRVKLHSLQKNLFRLHLTQRALLLRTDTQSDKLRWISALSRPHSEIDFSAAQDFTQMQCIRAIVAQQPDELSLEKADIILVHQQSSDHWVEGTRLSDRHRGWIPESHLETITNSKIRQRNLSDALKLTTATAAV
ncbi:trichohyalin [Centropristis striata]|uniref:trichohyalin n=1 Tax=Centropristis striata TaxID=184440 RepID=UPI0027DED062|nr:trichohyalin [Centropristis striata]